MAAKNSSSGFYGKGYDTVDDAAAAALMALGFQPRVATQEYMGMIVQNPNDGKYYRADFQTDGRHDTSSWGGIPGGKIAAIVHNHPSPLPGEKYPMTDLSVTDVNNANQLRVPNYITAIAPLGTNEINKDRRYVPGQTQTYRVAGPGNSAQARGDEFLAEFPIDEFKQFLARKLLGRAPDDPRGLTVTGQDMGPK